MSLLLLAMSVLSAWLTYNVYRPRYYGRAAVWSFFAGWLWGELALHMIVAQVLVAALFAAAGAVEGLSGQIAILIMTTSCGALAYSYLESERAGHAIESALRVGLVDDSANRLSVSRAGESFSGRSGCGTRKSRRSRGSASTANVESISSSTSIGTDRCRIAVRCSSRFTGVPG